jgi:uncharacterized membrane protein YdjX (TVP38/TMEM64 family)
MPKFFKFEKIITFVFIVGVLIALFFLLKNNSYSSDKDLGDIQKYALSYGSFAPMVIVFMVIVSTALPPLPLPVPLIEIASGVIFGFWKGWIISWVAQLFSSFAAFTIVRLFNKSFAGDWLRNKHWGFYHEYIKEKGAKAILITRATMIAPFNIVSFVAGLTHIPWKVFLWSTAIGILPETFIYSFIGSGLRNLHINIVLLSTLILVIGLTGFGLTFLPIKYLRAKLFD